MKYLISRNEAFTGLKPIEVEYDYPPPCLFCDQPVTSPSTDGPLVCSHCDCGCNVDGSPWTSEQKLLMWNNRKKKIRKLATGT